MNPRHESDRPGEHPSDRPRGRLAKQARHRLLASLAALLGLLLGGCGDQPPEQDFYVEPSLPDNPTRLTDAAAEEVADRNALPGLSVISPVEGSGVSGEVAVTTRPDGLRVTVEVTGLPEAAEYSVHVHRGVCAEGGPVAVALSPVAVAADASGASVTRLPADELSASEPLFVQLHSPSGSPLACGDLVEPEG